MLKSTPEFQDAPPPPDKTKGPPPPPSDPASLCAKRWIDSISDDLLFPRLTAVVTDHIASSFGGGIGDTQKRYVARIIDEAFSIQKATGAPKTKGTPLRALDFLLHHPDRDEVTRACLHFLGDEAQAWWEERQKSQNPADLDGF